jgi:hypothetical protein
VNISDDDLDLINDDEDLKLNQVRGSAGKVGNPNVVEDFE